MSSWLPLSGELTEGAMGGSAFPQRVIAVDLTDGRLREESWDEASRRAYFGGRGLLFLIRLGRRSG